MGKNQVWPNNQTNSSFKIKKLGANEYTITGSTTSTNESNPIINHPLITFGQDKSNTITVNETADIHPLYLKNIKSFNNAKADENLKLQPRFNNHFNLSVTIGSLDRSLKLMNALLNAFEIRGWTFKYTDDSALKMKVIIWMKPLQPVNFTFASFLISRVTQRRFKFPTVICSNHHRYHCI